ARMLELEAEKKCLQRGIEVQTCNLKPFDREHVRFYFESFRNGNVGNKEFQKRLFNQFVYQIYLYDDEMKIGFSCSKNKEMEPFKIMDEVEDLAQNSIRVSSALSHQTFLMK
ncbi:MAG: hypothetical protein RR224_12865, partial [Clostridia bacterium]